MRSHSHSRVPQRTENGATFSDELSANNIQYVTKINMIQRTRLPVRVGQAENVREYGRVNVVRI